MSAAAAHTVERSWFLTVALAGLTFGIGLIFRKVRWPRALAWLGLISYSIYLLHPLLIELCRHFSLTRRHYAFWPQVLVDAIFLVILIAICSLTYLLVEKPMQSQGRRVARWLDARFGADRAPGWTPPAPATPDPVPAYRPRPATE
jgi:peptidoglycan/LPS O-acetylase OafA/YrhL